MTIAGTFASLSHTQSAHIRSSNSFRLGISITSFVSWLFRLVCALIAGTRSHTSFVPTTEHHTLFTGLRLSFRRLIPLSYFNVNGHKCLILCVSFEFCSTFFVRFGFLFFFFSQQLSFNDCSLDCKCIRLREAFVVFFSVLILSLFLVKRRYPKIIKEKYTI